VSEAIKVDIWSDVQCPWCYIGKRRFEAAVAAFPGRVDITYHSFELAPDTPLDYEGTPVDYLSERKGVSREQAEGMIAHVTGIAASVGLRYDYAHMHQTNTVKAHELLHYAKAHGRQLEMKEALLKAYFIDGRHLGRVDELAAIAEGLGFDREDVIRALESEEHLAQVKADVAQAAAYGINGVPFFVFEDAYGVSGAQETALFSQVLEQIAQRKAQAAAV